MPATPSYARRRLGTELRRFRGLAGYSLDDVAEHFGWDKSKVSRIENAKVGVSRHDLHRLGRHYGLIEDELVRLEKLMNDSRGVRWWTEYGDLINSEYEELIALESQAARITLANSSVLPGLLQCPSYSEAVVSASAFVPDPDNAEALAQVRGRRQEILTDDENPVELVAMLGANLLYCEIGGREVLREQLAHLLSFGSLSNVAIQVIPFTAPAGICLGGITILDFPERHDPSVVHIEYQAGSVFKESERDVKRYRRNLDHIRSHALAPDESLSLIKTRLEKL